jgi:hypothetical protein
MDWSASAVRSIGVGHLQADVAAVTTQRFEAMMRAGRAPFVHYFDAWRSTGYESGWRVGMVAWTQKHPGIQKEVHVLTQSKVVNMAIAVTNLAVRDLVKGYSKRQEFDILVKKAGIPVDPPMPALRASPDAR